MNKIIILFILFASTSCVKQPECDCENFKTGSFKSEIEIKGVKKAVTFIRTENLQIETLNGITDTSSVRWINDCEFITRKLHPKTMQEEKSFSVKIIETNKNQYTCEFAEVGKQQKMTAVVKKVVGSR